MFLAFLLQEKDPAETREVAARESQHGIDPATTRRGGESQRVQPFQPQKALTPSQINERLQNILNDTELLMSDTDERQNDVFQDNTVFKDFKVCQP